MAKIRFHATNEYLEGNDKVRDFLSPLGVTYEVWGIDRLPVNLRENYQLRDEEKSEIIELFRKEIDEISARRGYSTADLVMLSENTPNLDKLLVAFRGEHHHTDDEVRFCVDGHGIFTINADDNWFDVEMEPGDLISVPSYTRHYFSLMDDRKIKAIRLFVTPAGWEAIYDKQTTA